VGRGNGCEGHHQIDVPSGSIHISSHVHCSTGSCRPDHIAEPGGAWRQVVIGTSRSWFDGLAVTTQSQKKGDDMDSTTVIRVISGILCVMILAVLVWRRKKTD